MKTIFRVSWHIFAAVGICFVLWLGVSQLFRGGYHPKVLWRVSSPEGAFEAVLVRSYWLDGDPEDKLFLCRQGAKEPKAPVFHCWGFERGSVLWIDEATLEITFPNETILGFQSVWFADGASGSAKRINVRLKIAEEKQPNQTSEGIKQAQS